jgi:hypothetical protein
MHKHVDAIITHNGKGRLLYRGQITSRTLYLTENMKKMVKDRYRDICMVEGEVSQQGAPV